MIEFIRSVFTAFRKNVSVEIRVIAIVTIVFFMGSAMQLYNSHIQQQLYFKWMEAETDDLQGKLAQCTTILLGKGDEILRLQGVEMELNKQIWYYRWELKEDLMDRDNYCELKNTVSSLKEGPSSK